MMATQVKQPLHTRMKVTSNYLHFIILYSIISNTDTVMASPPKGTILAYRSSGLTGGVFWGRAWGNAINIGNPAEVWEEMDVFREGLGQKQVKGKIHFYISNLNPPNVDITKSSFIANVSDISKCQTIQDVIGCGSQGYLPIRCKIAKFSGKYILITLHRTYLWPLQIEDGWSVQGHFESIVKCKPMDEDYVEWLDDEQNRKIVLFWV